MSLADLLGGEYDDSDGPDDSDSDSDPEVARPPSTSTRPSPSAAAHCSWDCTRYGVPYDVGDSDEDEDDSTEGAVPNDEIRFSVERFFTPRVRQLLDGTMVGGNPASLTGLLTGVRPMLLHQTQSPHPERPARIVAIYNEIVERGLDARSRLVPVRTASMDDLVLVHSRAQVEASTAEYVSDEAATDTLGLGTDTYFAATDSGRAALLSAGSVVELTTRVITGELRNALAVTRPPGHHCEASQAMGFCLLNNVCVAVAVARRRLGVSRVLVVDWDVHHGNGVQHIFDDDPNVLYVSTHRYGGGFYPGTGHPSEVGVGAGIGTSINIAFTHEGYGDREYLAAFHRLILPVAREFGPELVLVSAGFDAARGDPLGGMAVSPAGYAHMTACLATLAEGKLVIALEGGYNLRSISTSAAACLATLHGEPPPPLPRGPAKPAALADIEFAVEALRPYWACLRPPQPAAPAKRPRNAGSTARRERRRRVRGPWWYRYL